MLALLTTPSRNSHSVATNEHCRWVQSRKRCTWSFLIRHAGCREIPYDNFVPWPHRRFSMPRGRQLKVLNYLNCLCVLLREIVTWRAMLFACQLRSFSTGQRFAVAIKFNNNGNERRETSMVGNSKMQSSARDFEIDVSTTRKSNSPDLKNYNDDIENISRCPFRGQYRSGTSGG